MILKNFQAKIWKASVHNRVQNIVANGENAHFISNFSSRHTVFKRLLLQMRQKASICGKRGSRGFFHAIQWDTLWLMFQSLIS